MPGVFALIEKDVGMLNGGAAIVTGLLTVGPARPFWSAVTVVDKPALPEKAFSAAVKNASLTKFMLKPARTAVLPSPNGSQATPMLGEKPFQYELYSLLLL